MSDTKSRIYRPFCGSIYRPLYPCGGGATGPCTDNLLANYSGVLTADELAYRSKVGRDREYFKAGSMKFDGTAYLSGAILSTDTVANKGTAIPTVSVGKIGFTAGICWDLKVTRGGVVIIWCPGVTGDGTAVANVLSNDGSNGLTVVNMPADFWQEHTNGGGSNYLNEFGLSNKENLITYSEDFSNPAWNSSAYLVNPVFTNAIDPKGGTNAVNVIAEDEASGATLLRSDFSTSQVNTYTLSTWARADVPVTLRLQIRKDTTAFSQIDISVTDVWQNFSVSGLADGTFSAIKCYLSSGPDAIEVDFDIFAAQLSSNSGAYAKTTDTLIQGSQPASQGNPTKDWLGNTLEYPGAAAIPLEIVKAPVFVGDGVCTADNASNAGATITSQSGTATATIDAGGTLSFPVGDYYQVTLSNGSKYSFTEGTPTETALTIYDRSGNGNHLTLTNASATNWQLKERNEYPLFDGYSKAITGFIPALLSDATKDAAGGDIEHPVDKTMYSNNPMVFSMAYAKPVIEMETDEGFNFFFDGAGGRNELTFADLQNNYEDVYFYESPDKLLIYGAVPIESCLTKTLKYLGKATCGEYMYDDDGHPITDDNGEYICAVSLIKVWDDSDIWDDSSTWEE